MAEIYTLKRLPSQQATKQITRAPETHFKGNTFIAGLRVRRSVLWQSQSWGWGEKGVLAFLKSSHFLAVTAINLYVSSYF